MRWRVREREKHTIHGEQGRVHGGGRGGTPPPFKFRGGYYPPPVILN